MLLSFLSCSVAFFSVVGAVPLGSEYEDIDLSSWNHRRVNETIYGPDFKFLNQGHRLLQLAAEHGAADIVSHLIWTAKLNYSFLLEPLHLDEEKDSERFKFDSSLFVAYSLAAENKHSMICQMIYQLGRLAPKDVIVVTAGNGLTSMVKSILLSAEAKPPKSPISTFLFGDSKIQHPEFDEAIIAAAKNGHELVLHLLLLDKRGDPHIRQNEALISAAAQGHLKCVELLCASSPVQSDDLFRAFIIASGNDRFETSQFLYDKVKELKGACPIIGKILEQAAESGTIDIVRLLRNDSCVVDGSSYYLNAIVKSCRFGKPSILECLVPDIASLKKDVWSKLLLAATEGGHKGIVQVLLKDNSTVQAFGEDNEALKIAVNGKNKEISKLLLSHYNPFQPSGVEIEPKATIDDNVTEEDHSSLKPNEVDPRESREESSKEDSSNDDKPIHYRKKVLTLPK